MTTSSRVLDIGNCSADHSFLNSLLAQEFNTQAEWAHDMEDALQQLDSQSFDLVLINRLMDRDGSSGLEIVKKVVERREGERPAVMLISNYPEAQQAAVEAGAEVGYGKRDLHSEETREKLAKFL